MRWHYYREKADPGRQIDLSSISRSWGDIYKGNDQVLYGRKKFPEATKNQGRLLSCDGGKQSQKNVASKDTEKEHLDSNKGNNFVLAVLSAFSVCSL